MSDNTTSYLKEYLILLGVIFAIVIFGEIWIFLFSDFAFLVQNNEGLKIESRLDYGIKALTATGTIFAGIAVFLNAYQASRNADAANKNAAVANKNAEIAENKQIIECFAKAIEQLGSEKIEVRIGAIYTLERIANDSIKNYWVVIQVIMAFIRDKTLIKGEDTLDNNTSLNIETDIQTALTVIGRRRLEFEKEEQRIILANINISKADLYKVNLDNASLVKANLSKAFLFRANLISTNLYKADLSEADLAESKLCGAILCGANLSEASLRSVDLTGADLSKANLYGANLIQAKLPKLEHLKRAKNWELAIYDPEISEQLGLNS